MLKEVEGCGKKLQLYPLMCSESCARPSQVLKDACIKEELNMCKRLSLKKVIESPDAAIFTRNHWIYLESASKKEPNAYVTFRATARWKSAWIAIDSHGPRKIYFTPIKPPPYVQNTLITHQAILHEVQLLDNLDTHISSPEHNPEIKRLLSHQLEDTKNEGLWGGNVKTLYVISRCHKLDEPFYYTRLIKLGDEKPIAADFKYSYSICHEYTTG